MALSNRSKTILSSIIVFIVSFMLVLAAEGIVRVRQYFKYGTLSHAVQNHVDETTGLTIPRPGMKTATTSINSLGFRGPEIEMPKPDGRLRIGFIGASTTYCAEVSSNEMVWTELVSRGLESSISNLSVDYINGGGPGYRTHSSLINLEKRMVPLQPDVVVIYHATNDLSSETRDLAKTAGIHRTSMATEASWIGRYSLLWHLVEKNLAIWAAKNSSEAEQLNLNPLSIGADFRQNLEKLVDIARRNDVELVALVTFSMHLRDGMTAEQQNTAMTSARYYTPYLSATDMLAGINRYNQIIRKVAEKKGTLLIEQENDIQGSPVYFKDSVHFTDAGSQAQAARILTVLASSTELHKIAAAKQRSR